MTSRQLRAIVALDPSVDRDLVQGSLPSEGQLEVVGVVDVTDGGWSILEESDSEVVIVACPGGSQEVLGFIEAAVRQRPSRPVVVLLAGTPNGFVRRMFEAGADDIVSVADRPDPASLVFALEKALARRSGGSRVAGGSLASMTCVLGPKGGAGKTLTACNLAVALAQSDKRVVLMDLDLQFGDVGLAMGLQPSRTIHELATSGGSLDSGKLEDYLVEHSSGARVLLAPTRPDGAAVIGVEFLREVFGVLRGMVDHVIVDTPPSFTPEVIAAIDASTDVCMVGMLDSLALKNTKLALEALSLMGYDGGRVRLVLNRADTRVGITAGDVGAIVGRSPDVLVPSHRDVARSVNEGVPIVLSAPRSEAARAFCGLAAAFGASTQPRDEEHAEHKPRKLLSIGRR